MKNKQVLAVDFGASGGRVMLGKFDGNILEIENLHRFSNDPVTLGDQMYWDFLRLFHEVKQGLLKAKNRGEIYSIGVDTWGVDYGLTDCFGRLLGNPIHYRDSRTAGMMKKSFERMDRNSFYEITGNQFMEINTAFQLMAAGEQMPGILEQAEALHMMPDLFRYYLSGDKGCEYSIASTTQLFHMRQKTWATEVMENLKIPSRLFQPLIPAGTITGSLRTVLTQELELPSMKVVAVAGHDTQSALAAVPSVDTEFIFLSCGTWSLFGTELKEPIINEASKKYNLTNELGVEGNYSFLKNIIGLWLIQESRRQWIREGKEYSFGLLEEMAGKAKALTSFINPDAPEFVPAGNIPERIRNFCRDTGQPVPETEGELVCCINQSLALSYRKALEEVEECTGKSYSAIHMMGGGTNSHLLCQMTANACGIPVIAGPVEATVLGNAMVQFIAAGEFSDLSQARQALIRSVKPEVYEPRDIESWNQAYDKFCGCI